MADSAIYANLAEGVKEAVQEYNAVSEKKLRLPFQKLEQTRQNGEQNSPPLPQQKNSM